MSIPNRCFTRRGRKLDRYDEYDKTCFHCANRKAVDGILIDECGHEWKLRDYFAYGSKQEIADYLKEHDYKTIDDILDNLD